MERSRHNVVKDFVAQQQNRRCEIKKSYTSPAVSAIGTIAVKTLQLPNKEFGVGDVFTFSNQPTCVEGVNCEDTSA